MKIAAPQRTAATTTDESKKVPCDTKAEFRVRHSACAAHTFFLSDDRGTRTPLTMTISAPPPPARRTTHVKTPLIHSALLSKCASECGTTVQVYLKMEALQPSGSFKDRGLGHSIAEEQARQNYAAMHVITSSGGNAGLACAYSAKQLGCTCTVFVPSSVEDFVVKRLQVEGAQVHVVGNAWDDCDAAARKVLQEEREAGKSVFYVHPFEGEDTIEGHATMVDEIKEQLEHQFNVKEGRPDALICSAGGTGLVRAMMRGLSRHFSDNKPRLIVTQCFGADSFGQSLTQARQQIAQGIPKGHAFTPVTLPAITSKATSLGARTCSALAVPDALRYGDEVSSLIVEDRMAQEAAWRFADDHRILVELACSCVMSPVYFAKRILSRFVSKRQDPYVVVLIVCGGNKINAATIESYRSISTGKDNGMTSSRVTIDGISV